MSSFQCVKSWTLFTRGFHWKMSFVLEIFPWTIENKKIKIMFLNIFVLAFTLNKLLLDKVHFVLISSVPNCYDIFRTISIRFVPVTNSGSWGKCLDEIVSFWCPDGYQDFWPYFHGIFEILKSIITIQQRNEWSQEVLKHQQWTIVWTEAQVRLRE